MSVELHAIPVKDGDATLLIDRPNGKEQKTILIDTGLRRNEAATYLRQIGISRIDLLLLSHIDVDHIGGMRTIIEEFDVQDLWSFDIYEVGRALQSGGLPVGSGGIRNEHKQPICYRFITADEGLKAAELKGVNCYSVDEGHCDVVGRFHIEVLWPPREFIDYALRPKKLARFLTEKRPLTEWVADEVESANHGERIESEPQLDRQEAQARAKRKLRRREQFLEGGDFDISGELDGNFGVDETDYWPGEHFSNNLSIVVRIRFLGDMAGTTLLFSGDLEDWTLLLARQGCRLKSSLWKVPHHASGGVGFDLSPFTDERFIYNKWWHELLASGIDPDEFHYFWRRWVRDGRFPPHPLILGMTHFSTWPGDTYSSPLLKDKKGGIETLCRYIEPAKSLVFPLPSRRLPRIDGLVTGAVWGELVSNRRIQRGLSLNHGDGECEAAVITLDV